MITIKKINVGIFSPSNNVLSFYKKRRVVGIRNLKEIGLNPIFSKNAIRTNSYTKNSISERINELNELLDKNVDLMIASIGGYLSVQLLDLIDFEKIKDKKVSFCGSSDITALLLALYVKTGMIMLYGPTYTVDLCNYGGIDEYTKDGLLSCYFQKNITYHPSNYKINEFIDWNELEKKEIIKKRVHKNNDWKIVKQGFAGGKLIGGNLSTILLILGSEYLPIDTFDGCILFLEDCETNINEFCSYLECLKLNGVFNKINGIIIGKFDSAEMNDNIGNLLNDYFQDYDIPIAYNIDFGHVSPILTLPIGANSVLNCIDDISLEIIFKRDISE